MDTTCFAYNPKKNSCRALSDKSGCGPACPFYKSKAKHEADKEAANQRLAGLPEEDQHYIAETYHRGNRPWLQSAWKGAEA